MYKMKLILISDTHGQHSQLGKLPPGDVLIHCGDVCGRSDEASVKDFATWFENQPHKHKIVIAGNHDKHMSARWFSNSIYLQDEAITIDGVKFYGSPWTPTFFDWFWMKDPGEDIAERWAQIPDDTDVLITHGPAANTGNLSRTDSGTDAGCEDLQESILRIKPILHCFGHIHEGYGSYSKDGVEYRNASICNLQYAPTNKPMTFELSS